LGELSLEQRTPPSGRRQFHVEFPLVDSNKIGDRTLDLLPARAAFPARIQMRLNRLLVVRRELSLNFQ
jgi:hypothetical protein